MSQFQCHWETTSDIVERGNTHTCSTSFLRNLIKVLLTMPMVIRLNGDASSPMAVERRPLPFWASFSVSSSGRHLNNLVCPCSESASSCRPLPTAVLHGRHSVCLSTSQTPVWLCQPTKRERGSHSPSHLLLKEAYVVTKEAKPHDFLIHLGWVCLSLCVARCKPQQPIGDVAVVGCFTSQQHASVSQGWICSI